VARYLVQDLGDDPRKKAEQIAIGQTAGAWAELREPEKAAVQPHLGAVRSVEELAPAGASRRALVEIEIPLANVGGDLGALMTACFGKVSMDGAIRWVDLEVPSGWPAPAGPASGIEGLRDRWEWPADRPPLMAILKPCLGLAPRDLARLFETAARGGVDIVKDDEVLAGEAQDGDGPVRRVEACRQAAERARSETGKRCRYAIHLSGPADTLAERAERLVAAGAECLLLNVFVYGLPWLHALRRRVGERVALMAHPAFSGAITGSAAHGVAAPLLLGKLLRLAGADLALFPSPYGTVALPKEVALDIARAHTRPLGAVRRSFPVPSAGIKATAVRNIVADFGVDVVVNAGTGIFGHADGALAGARAFVKAIDEATT
jgi:2,3-diketo-5-methylthiopentyl-1-phosphate enolase